MTDEQLNALRQADCNLREALVQDEAERPQLSADLNERLMQRVAQQRERPRRTLWPWIAAACVAGVMMIWLTPPREDAAVAPVALQQPQQAAPVASKPGKPVEQTTIPPAVTTPAVGRQKALVARVEVPAEAPATPTVNETASETAADVAVAATTQPEPQAAEKPVTLTERDIPVTRPENYKYTAEEIALMKKQAHEAYLKWAQLELEIARYNLEQTAQK